MLTKVFKKIMVSGRSEKERLSKNENFKLIFRFSIAYEDTYSSGAFLLLRLASKKTKLSFDMRN